MGVGWASDPKTHQTYLVSLLHLADDFPVGGVDGREGLAALSVHPLVVDEALKEENNISNINVITLSRSRREQEARFK